MNKSTLLTAALALCTLVANADDKVIYQDNFTDEATSLASWTNSRGDVATNATSVVNTNDGNYIQFGNGTASFNGTRFSTLWGNGPWDGVTLPEDGYTLSFSFNFAQFGNNSSKDSQRNNEFAIVNSTDAQSATESFPAYYGDAQTVFPNYLFKLTQCKGTGGVATSPTGTCYFQLNNNTDSVNIAAGTWYNVTLSVVGQQVSYNISSIDGTPLTNGAYTLPTDADNLAGGIVMYQARYLGITQFMNIKMYYATDEDVANTPTVLLKQVQGNDRIFKATFHEDEVLHYVLPGGEEQTLEYYDAEDEITGEPGTATLRITQSGTMKVWTTKNDAVSKVVEKNVTTGVIKLVEPVVSIASVSEGFSKTYKISIDNSQVLLNPTIALTYVINYEDGTSENGEIENGGNLEVTKKGSLQVTANTIPVNGVEYYDRSSITIENDVEYEIAEDVQYINWTAEQLDAKPDYFVADKLVDTNTSHWIGHWMNELTSEGEPHKNKVKTIVTDPATPLPIYTLKQDEATYSNAVLPLIPNVNRANVAILLEEGLFVNGTKYNNLELSFDPKYVTDDAAKPNFVEITKTGSYDRYDKQSTCHSVDIVKTDATDYTLYRFDTAINRVRIFAYKGFNPGTTGINGVIDNNSSTNDANAPVYSISGVRVNKTNLPAGIYIQNGKKFIVK
jgi:hypothetical protein